MNQNMIIKNIIAILTFIFLSVTAQAADKAIIVFDASGSMWGQVEGQTKIAIAKKTLNQVVKNWDEEKELGLLAYGHRRKGDCKDIEALVPVGKVNKSGMISEVSKINPKGKTPISASIKQAADELKFTEDNATIILISDGKETCNADPCATATELEKIGVNFTAHVIGFDVDTETSKQLKCIADNTGGKYFPANNAKELNDALQEVVEQPVKNPKKFTIRAINEESGALLNQAIEWKLINKKTEQVISLKSGGASQNISIAPELENDNEKEQSNEQKEEMISAGQWLVSGISGIYSGEATVEITGDSDQLIKVDMIKKLPKVTITAPDEATTGTEIIISWDAPKVKRGRINLQTADDKPNFYAAPLVNTANNKEHTFRLPSVKGNYLIRFYSSEDRKTILAEKSIRLKPAEITIIAPDEAVTGTELEVSWKAPKSSKARLNLQLADEKPKFYSNPAIHTDNKTQDTMRLPSIEGDYVLRWFNDSDQKMVTERPIKIVKEAITITAPDEAATGTEIDISWTAPKTSRARLNLQLADEKPKFYSNPAIHTDGKTQDTMRLPSIEGDYVLRWFNDSDQKMVTERPIKIVKEAITITAPDEAGAGTEIDISWVAPKTSDARISLQLAEDKPEFYSNPAIHTKGKKEDTMMLPSTAGEYVLRWFNNSDREPVSERPIKLVEKQITLNAPDEAGAGTEIDLSWDAPKTSSARVSLQLADEKPEFYSNPSFQTKGKKESTMRLPAEAGDYVLRWYNNSDRRIIKERPIKIIEQQITITSQDEAIAGTEVEISWDAPKGLKAYINIQLADEKPNSNTRPFLYIKKNKSDYMRVPAIAGKYMLRWYNTADRKILAERPITLTKPEITINAVEKATAGTELDISWEAPKGLDSFINIQLADEKPSPNAKHYIYTKKKTSEYLRLPSEAGNYILRWYTRQGYKVLAEKPITLEAATIEITAVDEAKAGSEIELFWKAPKGLDSFINIQLADEKPNYNASPYHYTKKKTSGYIKVPEQTGHYMLRWYNKNDHKVIAERPIKIISDE